MKNVFLVCFVSLVLQLVSSDAVVNQDSYLNALQDSHQNNGALANLAREDYDYHSHDYHPGYDYQPAPIKPHYDSPIYGPPKPVYGPPPPVYGPPHPVHPPVYHNHPREHWLLDKFKLHVDLFTIGKILLKLIIFKKIIKFIALICLLLFLPKLQMKDDDENGSEEHGRFIGEREKLNARINEVTDFALTAFETFSKKYDGCKREQIWCRFERMFDKVDAKYSYDKIVKLYLPDNDITTNKVATD